MNELSFQEELMFNCLVFSCFLFLFKCLRKMSVLFSKSPRTILTQFSGHCRVPSLLAFPKNYSSPLNLFPAKASTHTLVVDLDYQL